MENSMGFFISGISKGKWLSIEGKKMLKMLMNRGQLRSSHTIDLLSPAKQEILLNILFHDSPH
jgi:hypothetical protein